MDRVLREKTFNTLFYYEKASLKSVVLIHLLITHQMYNQEFYLFGTQ